MSTFTFLEAAPMRISSWLFAAVVTLCVVSAPIGAQSVDVTGKWAMTVETGQGGGNPVITFKQDGEALTGTYEGQLGSTTFTGSIKGNAIRFSFNVNAQGMDIDVAYDGTTDGKTMKGSVNMAGGQLTGTFTGTKQ
jgi:hypothetical protein